MIHVMAHSPIPIIINIPVSNFDGVTLAIVPGRPWQTARLKLTIILVIYRLGTIVCDMPSFVVSSLDIWHVSLTINATALINESDVECNEKRKERNKRQQKEKQLLLKKKKRKKKKKML